MAVSKLLTRSGIATEALSQNSGNRPVNSRCRRWPAERGWARRTENVAEKVRGSSESFVRESVGQVASAGSSLAAALLRFGRFLLAVGEPMSGMTLDPRHTAGRSRTAAGPGVRCCRAECTLECRVQFDRPIAVTLMRLQGFEPWTYGLKVRCSTS